MSEWITDRRPTDDDAYYVTSTEGIVWITNGHDVEVAVYHDVVFGTPWMPITPPEPYVKPKRWRVTAKTGSYTTVATGGYIVYDSTTSSEVADSIPTREAAERIAAIYEEVMP